METANLHLPNLTGYFLGYVSGLGFGDISHATISTFGKTMQKTICPQLLPVPRTPLHKIGVKMTDFAPWPVNISVVGGRIQNLILA